MICLDRTERRGGANAEETSHEMNTRGGLNALWTILNLAAAERYTWQLHLPPHRLIFNTHAGWERSSSGRSRSSTDTPILEGLNFSGMVDPRRLTDLAPVTSFRKRLRSDQCGRIAYRSLPLVVKKASMPAFPDSDFSVSLVTS